MEWFHFSDFHIGRPKGPQTNAMATLIDAVKLSVSEHSKGKIDVVFITGDIAHSGKSSEYERFCNEFLLPLRQINEFSESTIFAVPGNHDVDCDATIPISWETIGRRNQEAFFYENADSKRIRQPRAVVFDAYWDFIQKNGIISPNPSQEISLLSANKNYPFDILGTNTAFFSDREKDSNGETTPSPIESIRHLLNSRSECKPVVILAHHPLSCFFRDQQPSMRTLLNEKKAVLFHGHEHKPSITFNMEGRILTFGFGASYLTSQMEQATIPYLNTFAYCRLDANKLSVRSYSWHSIPGKWLNSTALQLSDCVSQNEMDSNVAKLSFPSHVEFSENKQTKLAIRTVRRAAPKPNKIFSIEPPGQLVIKRLFYVSQYMCSIYQKGTPSINEKSFEDGKIRFELELENGNRYLLLFIYAPNHILSSKEVEAVNTELDTEGFLSATVISFGKISPDAQTMYLRLQTRKPIEILVNESIATETNSLLTEHQKIALSQLDAARHSAHILLGSEDLYLLIIDEGEQPNQFYIISGNGKYLNSTDPIVARLRRVNPDFSILKYAGEGNLEARDQNRVFVEEQYLLECYKEYNVLKYAALANVGIRFTDLPLEELYISASASDVSDKTAMRFEQFVGDHLAAYPMSNELRDHVQKQLLAQVSCDNRQETSHALEFCQKYSAVLITGDPGSGKTCFVKSEILAYCRRASGDQASNEGSTADWHSNHIPVMVALSEVAAEKDLDDNGLFNIASRLLERRGLYLPADEIESLATQGRLALFFDGLDEVVSVEKRAQIVKHINNFTTEHLAAGNRVVVTSRPAAVQVVNLLPTLHRLELQGLTEAEIRKLAGRLLALRLSATTNDILLGEKELSENDNILISQLIDDCEKNPGVSRMAQNPLLLTLLIMIYANSGAPSAKRHRIYEEAIKTLASVRGREAGHQPISVQDLRERLGAIALSVYKKDSGILPFRSEVTDVVRRVMERQRNEVVSKSEANSFIQRVAESTGLIALEARDGEEDDKAIVTFMHHSFLEYFAAVGLSRELERIEIGELVQEPRWREILTLLAGIVGENEDISPVINRFLESGLTEHDVDAKILLFAIDCALECEVPSESAQRLLSASIEKCLKTGVGRLDPWVRAEIGQRLAYLLAVCGDSEFNGMLAGLIRNGDEAVSAAAISVAGYAFENEQPSNEIMAALENACSRTDATVLSAICLAAGRSKDFRTDAALQVIMRCLGTSKSKRTQQVALEALARVPSIAFKYWDDIIKYINDNNSRTSRLASIAAMHAGLNIDIISMNAAKKDILIRALDNVSKISVPDEFRDLRMNKETLEHLLASATRQDRLLGIRLLPLAKGEERYVYERLIDIVRGNAPREDLVAALIAFQWSGNVIALIRIDDLKVFSSWMSKGTSDVRVAAARLLGYFGKDKPAIDALLSEDFRKLDIEDYCQRVSSLSQAKVEIDRVKELFFKELNFYFADKRKTSSSNIQRIETLLDASVKLGENAPPSLVSKVIKLIEDFKVNKSLKQRALLCLPAIAVPSETNVRKIAQFFINPRPDLETELVQVPSILAKNCRSSVDHVVASVGALSELRGRLLELHSKYSQRKITEQNEYYVTELRNGIDDVTQIIVAFKDFIGTSIQT